jgi:hypothetical protein
VKKICPSFVLFESRGGFVMSFVKKEKLLHTCLIIGLILLLFSLVGCGEGSAPSQEDVVENTENDRDESDVEDHEDESLQDEQTQDSESQADNQDIKTDKWHALWTRPDAHASAKLQIQALNKESFAFELSASWQARTGSIFGEASLLSSEEAIYEDENGCTVTFILLEDNKMEITTTEACSAYGGMNVTFAGTFLEGDVQPEISLAWVFEDNPKLDSDFKELVGEDYDLFGSYLAAVNDIVNVDDFEAKGKEGFVTGAAGFANAIIMYNDAGSIWAAVTGDEKVHYYTNDEDYKGQLPETIKDWYENQVMGDVSIVYMNQG